MLRQQKSVVRILLAMWLCMVIFVPTALACNDVLLTTKQGYIHARNMDFSILLKAQTVTVNVGTAFTSYGSDGSKGLEWKNSYAYVGMESPVMAKGDVLDGINDQGVSIAVLWLAGTKFAKSATGTKAMASTQLVSYLLGTAKNVQDIKEKLKGIELWGEAIAQLGDAVPTVHLACTDVSGGYCVVEFIAGKVKVYDNPLHALTNEPEFPVMQKAYKVGKKASGSVHRFWRAATFAQKEVYATQKAGKEAAESFFRSIHLPYKKGKHHTQWFVIKDLQEKNLSLYKNNKLVQVVPVPVNETAR